MDKDIFINSWGHKSTYKFLLRICQKIQKHLKNYRTDIIFYFGEIYMYISLRFLDSPGKEDDLILIEYDGYSEKNIHLYNWNHDKTYNYNYETCYYQKVFTLITSTEEVFIENESADFYIDLWLKNFDHVYTDWLDHWLLSQKIKKVIDEILPLPISEEIFIYPSDCPEELKDYYGITQEYCIKKRLKCFHTNNGKNCYLILVDKEDYERTIWEKQNFNGEISINGRYIKQMIKDLNT